MPPVTLTALAGPVVLPSPTPPLTLVRPVYRAPYETPVRPANVSAITGEAIRGWVPPGRRLEID